MIFAVWRQSTWSFLHVSSLHWVHSFFFSFFLLYAQAITSAITRCPPLAASVRRGTKGKQQYLCPQPCVLVSAERPCNLLTLTSIRCSRVVRCADGRRKRRSCFFFFGRWMRVGKKNVDGPDRWKWDSVQSIIHSLWRHNQVGTGGIVYRCIIM